MTGDISVAELARQVQSAFTRLESMAARLESGQFVRADVADLRQAATDAKLAHLEQSKVTVDSYTSLASRVTKVEETLTWVWRVVGAFIILAVLGFVFQQSGGKP